MDDRQTRLKRLRMRSWRRGTKEMDLILGPFSDSELEGMNDPELDLYETLLDENDQDLYPGSRRDSRAGRPGPRRWCRC
ncbi:succinate dehydrogenase assembly factor 2 [Paracoccus kondratievae]